MASVYEDAIKEALPRVYVIVNGALGVHSQCVERSVLGIAMRSFDVLTDEAIVGNLWRIWGTLKLAIERVEPPVDCPECFNLLSMPLTAVPKETTSIELTKADTQRLFKLGQCEGRQLPVGWCHHVHHLSRPEIGER